MDIKMNDHRSLRMPRGVRSRWNRWGNEVAGANLTCKWILHYIQISFPRKCVPTTIRTRGVRETVRNPWDLAIMHGMLVFLSLSLSPSFVSLSLCLSFSRRSCNYAAHNFPRRNAVCSSDWPELKRSFGTTCHFQPGRELLNNAVSHGLRATLDAIIST